MGRRSRGSNILPSRNTQGLKTYFTVNPSCWQTSPAMHGSSSRRISFCPVGFWTTGVTLVNVSECRLLCALPSYEVVRLLAAPAVLARCLPFFLHERFFFLDFCFEIIILFWMGARHPNGHSTGESTIHRHFRRWYQGGPSGQAHDHGKLQERSRVLRQQAGAYVP